MKNKSILPEKFKRNFFLSLLFIAIATTSLLFIPIAKLSNSILYIIAALFWLSVIAGQIFFWMCNTERKKMEQKSNKKRKQKKEPPGIVVFFRNKESFIADIVLFTSILLTTILNILRIDISWLIIISISVLFLSFNLHCILNGKNYKCIKDYEKYKKQKEQNADV